MAQCVVCSHPDRDRIEEALLCRNWGDSTVTLKDIASEFGVDLRSLQVHSLMHLPIEQVMGDASSITEKIKMKEGDLLKAVANEYYVTLKNIGVMVNKAIASDDPVGFKLRITMPLVDLYLGCGTRVKEAVDGMIRLNQVVEGGQNSGLNALAALINSIHGTKEDEEETDD